jgi:hypothetical protein
MDFRPGISDIILIPQTQIQRELVTHLEIVLNVNGNIRPRSPRIPSMNCRLPEIGLPSRSANPRPPPDDAGSDE